MQINVRFEIYLNILTGVFRASHQAAQYELEWALSVAEIHIGNIEIVKSFGAYFREYRLWKTERSLKELQANLKKELRLPKHNLVQYYKFADQTAAMQRREPIAPIVRHYSTNFVSCHMTAT